MYPCYPVRRPVVPAAIANRSAGRSASDKGAGDVVVVTAGDGDVNDIDNVRRREKGSKVELKVSA